MDEDVAAFLDLRRPSEPGEMALFRSVIVQAFNDAMRGTTAELRDEALEWVEWSDTFALYADLAGVADPEALRARMVARIDQERPGWAISERVGLGCLVVGRTVLTSTWTEAGASRPSRLFVSN